MSFSSSWIGGLSRLGGGYVGLVGVDLNDRDQRQTYVAHLLEQAMKSGLVDDKAMDEGGAVALVGEAQSVEPSGPSRSEVTLETDFVPSNLVPIAS
jgi:hypothetical protein